MKRTFGSILAENNGIGPGFDLLRLALALSILAGHCSAAAGIKGFLSIVLSNIVGLVWHGQIAAGPIVSNTDQISELGRPFGLSELGRPFGVSHVPMFFALSGFLVMGSAFRTRKVGKFLALRFFRIFPALLVEVTLSAVILGAVFTSLPLRDYYTNPLFWSYFLNTVGDVHMYLPGVTFGDAPTYNGLAIVNGNLWTLPPEFWSYAITAVLIVSGLLFRKWLLTVCFAVATVILLVGNTFYGFQVTQEALPEPTEVYFFFSGVMFYIWRDKIPYSWTLFMVCAVGFWVLCMNTRLVYFYPLLLTYVTVFIGLTKLPSNSFLRSGDYSYGLYLYGSPIIWALSTVPGLRHNLLGLVVTSIPASWVVAALSWHFVEKQFLRLRKRFF
jgi:peptidoglycan/LPS O-acetylase OafA/YrhL